MKLIETPDGPAPPDPFGDKLPPLPTINQTCGALNCSRTTLYRYVKDGRLKAVRLSSGAVRIDRQSVLELARPQPAEL